MMRASTAGPKVKVCSRRGLCDMAHFRARLSARLRRRIQARTPVRPKRLFPEQPSQTGFLGQQIFFYKTVSFGEPESAVADDHDVVATLHDKLRNL